MHAAIIHPNGPDPQETEYAKEQRIFAQMQTAENERKSRRDDGTRAHRRGWSFVRLIARLRSSRHPGSPA